MPDFDAAFEKIIGLEGGYVNDPDDPGGETKFGISKKQYPHLYIPGLTIDDAKHIYDKDYWSKLRADAIQNQAIAEELFEAGVNVGVHRAIGFLQESLSLLGYDVDVDRRVGPQTLGATAEVIRKGDREVESLLKCMNSFQFMWYVNIIDRNPTLRKYIRGWLRRIEL